MPSLRSYLAGAALAALSVGSAHAADKADCISPPHPLLNWCDGHTAYSSRLSIHMTGVTDSLINPPDSSGFIIARTDSSLSDTIKRISKDEFKSKVMYNSDDSIRFDIPGQKVFLYGNASIKYEDTNLTADYIEIDWEEKTLFAKGLPDSTGALAGLPVFKEKSDEFKANEMKYNFETKKRKIIDVSTSEGDGIIRGGVVKKTDDNEYYIRGGSYTTCDATHPHFYIASKKIKVIPNNKIVTGPANLVIEDVPTPFFIPFGFFPTKKGRKSGILFPAYGESTTRGFFLCKGGYYFGFSDYMDASLDGDIYSLGGWAARLNCRYINQVTQAILPSTAVPIPRHPPRMPRWENSRPTCSTR